MTALTLEQIESFGIKLDQTPELRPGMDFRRNQLYFVIAAAQDETKTVGRGKTAKEVTQRVVRPFFLAANHDFGPYDPDVLEGEGFRPVKVLSVPDEERWPAKGRYGWLKYATGKASPIDREALYTEIRAIYVRHLEYADETYHDVAALYTIGSYLFRIWSAYPYLHLNGTRASGKSQTLRVMQGLGLNALSAGSMSQSALLRTASGNPGVVCVDEAEQLNGEKGEDLRLLLNGGYQASGMAIRSEKDATDNWHPVEYPTYGPKVLASINPLEPTLQSRCIVISTEPTIRPIPDFKPDAEEWVDVRGQLYHFALQHAPAIAALTETWDATLRAQRAPDLISRQWELAKPLVVLADYCGGPPLADRLIAFFRAYYATQAKTFDEIDRTRIVLKALPRVIRTMTPYDASNFYSLKDIHSVTISFLEEDAREKVTTRSVSRHLTTLGFKDRKGIPGGTAIRLDPEHVKTQFAKRRVDPHAEDAAWFDIDYTPLPVAPETPVTRQPEFDWLDGYNEVTE